MSEHQVLLKYARHLPAVMEQLYRTPADVGEWGGFLDNLVEATDSRSARLLVMDRQAETVHYSTKVNIDDHLHRQYVDHFVNLCPWRPELALKDPGRLYSTFHEFSCKQRQFYKTEFFNDWARHLDIEHGVCGTVYHDDRYTVQLLIQRTGGQGAFSMELTRTINELMPHVRQALQLNRMMALQQQQQLSALAAAEKAFMPFLLLDGQGRLVHASQRARLLVAGCRTISLDQGLVRLSSGRSQMQFRLLLQKALQAGSPAASEVMLVFCEERATPLRLVVEPVILAGSGEALWPQDACVAVFIQDPYEHLDIDREALARMLGLTPAEARVAAGLALGRGPASLAEEAGVSLHTVRTQTKSILAKTGLGRQVELVGLVLRSVAVRGVGGDLMPVSPQTFR